MSETLPADVLENIRISREDAAGDANYAYRFQRATIILADALERAEKAIEAATLEERNECALIAQREAERLAALGEHGNEALIANRIARAICARTPYCECCGNPTNKQFEVRDGAYRFCGQYCLDNWHDANMDKPGACT